MRGAGALGFCKAPAMPRIFRWGAHFGEEPPLTGEGGSGAIFFSRCTMRCIYCQNSPWSWRGGGEDVPVSSLASIMRRLAGKCANWNLVSPTPYLPFIREAAHMLAKDSIRLPFVWNTSGYERAETIDEYRDLADVALCDLRYAHDATAIAASSAPGYVETARNALKRFVEIAGDKLALARDGTATRGVICRILVLPGHSEEAVENLAWIAGEIGTDLAVSVMSQYTPSFAAKETPPWNRGVTREEYDTVAEAAMDFGFGNGWLQIGRAHV